MEKEITDFGKGELQYVGNGKGSTVGIASLSEEKCGILSEKKHKAADGKKCPAC
jgi:hypothetical protein